MFQARTGGSADLTSSASSASSRHVCSAPVVGSIMPALRPVSKVVKGVKMQEGAGVVICRTLGTPALRNLDPFLMLDEMKLPANQAFAGFPDHPHRGFETCSIMLEGEMEHRDSAGNMGVIGAGGVQWMTAGRGIVHSEMPRSTDGMLWGFQLWINLPKKDKMCKPKYQDYQASDIPAVEKDGVKVRVMAGEVAGVTGPIVMRNPGQLADVTMQPGASWEQQIPSQFNSFVYISDGAGKINGNAAGKEQALVLGEGDTLTATAGTGGLRFLLVSGKPIGEPVEQYGPFVMNTKDEIRQAFEDYRSGKLQNPDDNPWEG